MMNNTHSAQTVFGSPLLEILSLILLAMQNRLPYFQFSKRLSDSVLVILDAITYYPLVNQSTNHQNI